MFAEKLKSTDSINGLETTSIIGTHLIISGEIKTDADMRIDGKLIGNIFSTAKVVIGADGYVEGNITALQSDVTGKITGNLAIEELLNLREKAQVKGDIVAGQISMESSVSFNGKCTMNESSTQVVEMVKDKNERRSISE